MINQNLKKQIREQEKRVPKGKILLPGGAGGRNKKFHSIANFEKIKKSMEATGKLDVQYFNNAKDIGMFIDWYNTTVKERKQAHHDNEITEISKLLAKISGRKSFIFKKD